MASAVYWGFTSLTTTGADTPLPGLKTGLPRPLAAHVRRPGQQRGTRPARAGRWSSSWFLRGSSTLDVAPAALAVDGGVRASGDRAAGLRYHPRMSSAPEQSAGGRAAGDQLPVVVDPHDRADADAGLLGHDVLPLRVPGDLDRHVRPERGQRLRLRDAAPAPGRWGRAAAAAVRGPPLDRSPPWPASCCCGSDRAWTTRSGTSIQMVAIYLVAATPFFVGGAGLALAISRLHGDIGRVYAADLLGAAAGLPGARARVERHRRAGRPAAGRRRGRARQPAVRRRREGRARTLVSWAPLAVAAVVLAAQAAGPWLDVRETKGHESDRVLFSKWNSFSRIAVYDRPHHDWGLSTTYKSRAAREPVHGHRLVGVDAHLEGDGHGDADVPAVRADGARLRDQGQRARARHRPGRRARPLDRADPRGAARRRRGGQPDHRARRDGGRVPVVLGQRVQRPGRDRRGRRRPQLRDPLAGALRRDPGVARRHLGRHDGRRVRDDGEQPLHGRGGRVVLRPPAARRHPHGHALVPRRPAPAVAGAGGRPAPRLAGHRRPPLRRTQRQAGHLRLQELAPHRRGDRPARRAVPEDGVRGHLRAGVAVEPDAVAAQRVHAAGHDAQLGSRVLLPRLPVGHLAVDRRPPVLLPGRQAGHVVRSSSSIGRSSSEAEPRCSTGCC